PAEESEGEADAAKKKRPAKAPTNPEGTYLAELAEWAGVKWRPNAQADAVSVAQRLHAARYGGSKVGQKGRARRPQAPFTTSTLQQTASSRLHFTAHRTMQTAQRLYEGVDLGSEGQVALITYMRTDSTRVSNEALSAVRSHIQDAYGNPYLHEKPNYY